LNTHQQAALLTARRTRSEVEATLAAAVLQEIVSFINATP
jgi:hypothetical protein